VTDYPDEIVTAAYPKEAVESVETPAEGNSKRTEIATLADGRRVVVQSAAEPATLETETQLTREIAARTPVPVPEIIETDGRSSLRYRVAEYVEGENLHERFVSLSPPGRRRVARQFGRLLAELHEAFTFERFGPLAAETDGLAATGPRGRAAWFESYAEAGVRALPSAFSDLESALLAAVRDDAGGAVTPRLYPWDLRPGNAVVRDGEVVAVPDWEEPLAAGAGLAVAKVEHLVADWYVDDPAPLRAAFRDGYASVRRLPEPTRAERLTAVVRSAVDAAGEVTRPGYPELTGEAAVAFHRQRLEELL
jgi:Ser/Thr protein kinase RdoA (MazF antagonist)